MPNFRDSGVELEKLVVDGAMTNNNLMMKIQADFLGNSKALIAQRHQENMFCPSGIEVVRPEMAEITSLGAAIAAGRAVGAWPLPAQDAAPGSSASRVETVFHPQMGKDERDARFRRWGEAVEKSLDWEK